VPGATWGRNFKPYTPIGLEIEAVEHVPTSKRRRT
jgi:hypothetical protein